MLCLVDWLDYILKSEKHSGLEILHETESWNIVKALHFENLPKKN